jgi:hypothetical protein
LSRVKPVGRFVSEALIIESNGGDIHLRKCEIVPGLFHLRDRRNEFRFIICGQTLAEPTDIDDRALRIVVGRNVNFDSRRIVDGLANSEVA